MAENDLLSGWRTFLRQLHARNIEAVVIGGTALSLHGLPRTTLDIDLVAPVERLADLFQIMDELGWESPQAALRSLATRPDLATGQCLSFRPTGGADLIDVFLATAPEVQELNRDAETIEFLGTPLRIASLRRLRAMKLATARPIDLADVAMIDEILGND